MSPKIHIGPKIRKIRLQKGLKLKDVARETGLSVSLISQVENNNSSASLHTLIKLADFLGTSASFLLEEPGKKESALVCRKKDRKSWDIDDGKTHIELLNPSLYSSKFEVVHSRLQSCESNLEKYTHQGEEFGLVLKGRIQVELGDEVYVLNEGDAIYFKSTIPHAICGIAPGVSETIWVISPPIKML